MNKQVNRELKSLNIRDFGDKGDVRQAIGMFKHNAYELGISQGEYLKQLMNNIYKIDKKKQELLQEAYKEERQW